ncbi:hypothetical protein [Streptomyces sp. SAJ15]|uniref:hypothetical protein n=1 Tax=Streptomyces sp. SAJ15 TaxID=2011095 RepID=UPI0016434297|nr:hypothetical protein [Streptomyces sp. SAJ15]
MVTGESIVANGNPSLIPLTGELDGVPAARAETARLSGLCHVRTSRTADPSIRF